MRSAGHRWFVLAVCWAAFTAMSADRSLWGPAAVAVAGSLGVSTAAIGVFATGYYVGYIVSNVAGGMVTDLLGTRIPIVVSCVGGGAAAALFAATTSVPAGLAVQALLGLLGGVDFAVGVKAIDGWFPPERRGFAYGVFMTASSVGTVLANAVAPALITSFGWNAAYLVAGVLTVLVGVAGTALPGRSGPVPSGGRRARALPDLRRLLRNRDLALLGLVGFGGLWGTYGFVVWADALMVRGSGVTLAQAGVVLAIFAGVPIALKPVVGLVCDRLGLGLRRPIGVLLLSFAAMLVVFGSLRSLTGFLLAAPFLGICAYAYSPLTAAMTARLADDSVVGSAAGAVNAFWQLGSLIVPSVVGPVFAATGSFRIALLVLAVGPAAGAALAVALREPWRPADRAARP